MDNQQITNYFLDLVSIPSPSRSERFLADKLINDLVELGFEVYEDDAAVKTGGNAGNVYGFLKGNSDKPPIILTAHMDTVAKTEPIKPVIKEGTIHSDGTTILSADDKAGICAIVTGIRTLVDNKCDHGDIEVIFTVCEEVGLLGSKNFNCSLLKGKMAYVMDSNGEVGNIVASAPAQSKLKFTFLGKAAHAGVEPEAGISAIKVAGAAIAAMNFGRIDSETTANLGTIVGGSATNVVAERVEIEAEARSRDAAKLDAQIKHMVETVKQAALNYGADYECQVEESYPGFTFRGDEEIIKQLMISMERCDIRPQLTSTGGGSDANIFNGKGIQAVNIAAGFFKPHTDAEFISIESLVRISKLVTALLEK